MNWRNFWEQYEVSIHSRTHLSDPEKLTYLRQSLKDSPARHVIEGLSGSGSDYEEAINAYKIATTNLVCYTKLTCGLYSKLLL